MPQTPIEPGARILLEPRLLPGSTDRLYVLVWEDGLGSRVEACAGPDADLLYWLGSSAAKFQGVPLADRRGDTPPPAEHACAWCPVEVRDLAAHAHNAAGAVRHAQAGQGDWARALAKVAELGDALDRYEPARRAHFAATVGDPAPVAVPCRRPDR